MSKLLIIENCNFNDFPTGGTLSFSKQLISTLPNNKIALVGITTDNIKIGRWTTLKIGSVYVDFFPILKINSFNKKPLIPLRIQSLFALFIYLNRIRKKKYNYVFTQTPQFIFALFLYKWESVSFCFAGLGNSVKLSRYKSLRFLGEIYETLLLKILNKKIDCIFAAADSSSINIFKNNHRSLIDKKIISLPTRYDETIFFPKNKNKVREKLRLPLNKKIIVTTGRLNWVKGWDFLINVLNSGFDIENFILIFVGDGEDRSKIEKQYLNQIGKSIIITGFVEATIVSDYINASDVFVLGSYTEGWSTSLVEALACGKPIVTTNVSSVNDIITDNENGFIVYDRNVKEFCKSIFSSMQLENVEQLSLVKAKKYCKLTLYNDIIKYWPQIKSVLE